MTKEEALRAALTNCGWLADWEGGDFEDDFEEIKKVFKEIEKDLEVLEILKKHYDEQSKIVSLGNFMSFSLFSDEEDFEKVKEWLKDEKDN